jgi:hypothetical protein
MRGRDVVGAHASVSLGQPLQPGAARGIVRYGPGLFQVTAKLVPPSVRAEGCAMVVVLEA